MRVERLAEQRAHHGARGLEAAVEKRRADHRLQRVGEDRRPARAAALQLALAQQQLRAEVEAPRDRGERLLVDEVRAQPRELAFGQLRKLVVELERDDAVQHAVAEELQPLVVGRAVAAVGQRAAQQLRLAA